MEGVDKDVSWPFCWLCLFAPLCYDAAMAMQQVMMSRGVQMMLLVANIARYDLPRDWPGLLPALSEEGNGRGNPRALRALKHVVRALKAKRAMPEQVAIQGGTSLACRSSHTCKGLDPPGGPGWTLKAFQRAEIDLHPLPFCCCH